MTPISRDSLQWQAAVNTFTSIMLAGFISIGLSGYFTFSQSPDFDHVKVELFLYHGLATILLVIIALIFAVRTYKTLAKPMHDLADITNTLPLLSAKKYPEAHKVFDDLDGHFEHKEINQLKFATIQLTSLLEKLDLEVSDSQKTIEAQKESLQFERDFIEGLLNTAQLIILTINEDFEITLINDYGQHITGFSKDQMIDSHVSRMFPAGNWTEAQTFFNELLNDSISIAQQDSELINKDNDIKDLSWLHTRIHDGGDKAVILSVGLDMTEKKAAEKHVIWLAEHDPLTDLCNRRKFTADFEKSIQMAIRYEHHSCLLIIDLDHFKDINDTSGHKMGDTVLKSVAKVLKSTTRFTDLVARIGGDEFAIVMPETDEKGAQVLAQKIINGLEQIQAGQGQFKHKISASIGIVHYPLHHVDAAQLLSYADLAMYQAKDQGKGTFHTYSPSDQAQEELNSRVFWKHQVESAIENNYFELFFQPLLKLETNTISHYEMLLRMRNPKTDELVMPTTFIQIAEQTGLIHDIDHYVLNHGIQKLASLQQAGEDVTLSLNLSGSMIDDPILIPLIKQLIKKHNIKPTNLIFEVTETLAVSNLLQANKMMQAIKALGCRFSLDDFGVGFSSFNYMRELPVDIIKIDGVFIKNLDQNADDRLFVKALVDVARGLGKEVVAEYVENEKILSLLRSYGVDYAQGYHIGKPQPKLLEQTDWVSPHE